MTLETTSHPHALRWRPGAFVLALLVSLCVNIGFASYIAIQALGAEPQSARRTPEEMISRVAARLPGQDGEALLQAYRAKASEILVATAGAQSARLRALALLAGQDLDRDALQAAFKDAIRARMVVSELLGNTLFDALGRISPEGRQQLVKEFRAQGAD
jgi:uncharacterized membrane protein